MPCSATSDWLFMAERFLHLGIKEQAQIYEALAPELGRSPGVLEKDVWVCWVLQTLFTMPGRLPMAFKGGTSLSKVYNAIARFSEDVDITLDYRGLDSSFDPFTEGVSKTRLKKFSDDLKAFVREYVHDVVVPHFHSLLSAEFDTDAFELEVSEDGEQLRLHYPSALEAPSDYMGNSVLIEFGGRNITEPNIEHQVMPDIAKMEADLELPCAIVSVLSPARTFWEKATLMHVECQRNEFRASALRLSRHWYDLAMLADLEYGQAAIADRALLADVIKHKKVFYNASYANYDACLVGQLRLIPDEDVLVALHDDFRQMIVAGMFIGDPPVFEQIINRLRSLESDINQ